MMPKQAVSSPLVNAPIGPYSQAVKVGPLLFISGQIALDEQGSRVKGGVARETEKALDNLKQLVEAAGATMEHVVKTTIFMTDLEDFKYVNQVYERYFPGVPPARSTVQVSKLPREAKVEIEAIVVIS
jgi:2-iminobutanoate/2-iminopropanoate deaminase